MNGPMRAGIVGCGTISAMHAGNYDRSSNVSLTAAADISPAALARFADQRPGLTTYHSVDEMVSRECLDIVSICTPPLAHLQPSLEAMRAGVRGLVIEKPLALTLADADALLAEAASRNVKLLVGHQLRYGGRYRAARRLIESGAIGSLDRIWAVCHTAPLQTNATHTVDLVRFLAGDLPVSWVMGSIDISSVRLYEGFPQEQAAVGFFQFEAGPIALIESGQLQPDRGYHHIYLDGSMGQMELTRTPGSSLRIRTAATSGQWDTPAPEIDTNPIDDLANAVCNGSEVLSGGVQGRATLEVILALFESARTRHRVVLPLTNPGNPLAQILSTQPQPEEV